jgi:hypothetical protein
MDQRAVEGAMNGASGGRSDRWCKRWKALHGVSNQSGSSRRILQAMDQDVVEGTCKRWIRKQSNERWMVQAMEGAIVGTSDGSRSSRMIKVMDNQDLVEGTCKRWFRMQSKE